MDQSVEHAQHPRQKTWKVACVGAAVGVLCTFVMLCFKLDGEIGRLAVITGGGIGAALMLSRARRLLGVWCCLVGGWVLLVAFSPLAHWAIQHADRTDSRGPADAVVVLGCGMYTGNTPSSSAEDRLLQGAELVRSGETHNVVLCGVLGIPSVKDQMRRWGADAEFYWSGPVFNTHDEALATARLAKEHGWKRVIVVTQAWHMRRAAAVFRSAGLNVLQSPAAETRYDMESPDQITDRFQAVRDWIHESIGYRIYHWRGWINE